MPQVVMKQMLFFCKVLCAESLFARGPSCTKYVQTTEEGMKLCDLWISSSTELRALLIGVSSKYDFKVLWKCLIYN